MRRRPTKKQLKVVNRHKTKQIICKKNVSIFYMVKVFPFLNHVFSVNYCNSHWWSSNLRRLETYLILWIRPTSEWSGIGSDHCEHPRPRGSLHFYGNYVFNCDNKKRFLGPCTTIFCFRRIVTWRSKGMYLIHRRCTTSFEYCFRKPSEKFQIIYDSVNIYIK